MKKTRVDDETAVGVAELRTLLNHQIGRLSAAQYATVRLRVTCGPGGARRRVVGVSRRVAADGTVEVRILVES